MKPLLLSGYNVKLKLENLKNRSELVVINGHDYAKESRTYSFRPRRIPYDSIFINGHSGYVSLKAMHWLSKNNVPVFVLNYNGSLISSILPPSPVKADLRTSQIKAYEDKAKKYTIAYELVKAKIQRTIDVLDWIEIDHNIDLYPLERINSLDELRSLEGKVAQKYWKSWKRIVPETFDFETRGLKGHHQFNASDPVNVCLNYGYGILEGICRRAINIVGFEPTIGYLHEPTGSQTKHSLVYDLQEPYRFLAELTVLKAIKLRILNIKDFYFAGDNFTYHFKEKPKRKFFESFLTRINESVPYSNKNYKWDTVILAKTQELARYIKDDSKTLDFSTPTPNINYM